MIKAESMNIYQSNSSHIKEVWEHLRPTTQLSVIILDLNLHRYTAEMVHNEMPPVIINI